MENNEIDNVFDNIANELEVRFHSIENELEKRVLGSIFFDVKKVCRLSNNRILKSQVGFIRFIGSYGDDFLNVKSVWFGEIDCDFDNIFLEFPKLLPVKHLFPYSNQYFCYEIDLRCVDFRDGVLYTSGISTIEFDTFLFRIHSQKSLDPEEFKFKWTQIGGQYNKRSMAHSGGALDETTIVGNFFVLDNNNVYFYNKGGVNQIGELVSRTFSRFILAFQEPILDLYVNDKYFIAKTRHNFLFHEKTTNEYLYKISLNFRQEFNFVPRTFLFVNSFHFIENYFVQIRGVNNGHVYFNLILLNGEVHSKSAEFKEGVLDSSSNFLKVVLVVKNCFWFRDEHFSLFKIQF